MRNKLEIMDNLWSGNQKMYCPGRGEGSLQKRHIVTKKKVFRKIIFPLFNSILTKQFTLICFPRNRDLSMRADQVQFLVILVN